MMEYFKLLIVISLLMYGNVKGRVLKDIIDVLLANPHTRYMVKTALMRWEKFGGKSSRRIPPMRQPNMYGSSQPNMYGPSQPNMYGPMISMIPLGAIPPMVSQQNGRDDNEEEGPPMRRPFMFDGGFPWRQYRNNYQNFIGMKNRGNNPQPNVQWKEEEEDEPGQQTKANYLQQSPKYLDENRGASGLALEVNGDMKTFIPSGQSPSLDYPEAPAAQYFQTPPGYLFGFRANANANGNDNEDFTNNGPLSDKMFRKKRVIIKELKRLFEVLFENEMGGASMYKQKENNIRFARGERKAKLNEKKSIVAKVKEGNIFKKSYRPNRRLTLYKRLIGDLNDLIALEIKKTNGDKKIGKVKDSAEKLTKLVQEANDEETNE